MDSQQKPLFNHIMVLNLDGAGVSTLYIYPPLSESDKGLLAQIPDFCFPDSASFPKKLATDEQHHHFILSGKSKIYGYVLRESPKVQRNWPTAFCILTDYPFQSLFEQILMILKKMYHTKDTSVMDEVCSLLRLQKIPEPGESLYSLSKFLGVDTIPRREEPQYCIHHTDSLVSLFSSLEPFDLITLYISLLFERRVIFVSSKLSHLAECVHAAVALLWPFSWQHVFIPVLPPSKLDFVCAPMPFVVGILSTELDAVKAMPMDEVMFVYLDSQMGLPPTQLLIEGDTTPLLTLPPTLLFQLICSFQEARNIAIESLTSSKKLDFSILKRGTAYLVSQVIDPVPCFIRESKFICDDFIKSSTPELSCFTEELTKSQLFNKYKNQFILPHIDDPQVQDFIDMQRPIINEFNYETADFFIKAGSLLVKCAKTNNTPQACFVVLNPSCLLLTDFSIVIPLSSINEIDSERTDRMSFFVLRTKNESFSIGDENLNNFIQWKQIVDFCFHHFSDSKLIIPLYKRRKNNTILKKPKQKTVGKSGFSSRMRPLLDKSDSPARQRKYSSGFSVFGGKKHQESGNSSSSSEEEIPPVYNHPRTGTVKILPSPNMDIPPPSRPAPNPAEMPGVKILIPPPSVESPVKVLPSISSFDEQGKSPPLSPRVSSFVVGRISESSENIKFQRRSGDNPHGRHSKINSSRSKIELGSSPTQETKDEQQNPA